MITIHCQDPWFSFIRDGLKPVEGRKGTPEHRKIKVGDLLKFTNGTEEFIAKVLGVKAYPSLEAYFEDVTLEKALPGVKTLKEGLAIYHQWSTEEQIREYGFLGIFITPVSD